MTNKGGIYLKIVLNKETTELMRCAKLFSEIEGKETGFFFYYYEDLPDYIGQHHVFPTELNVGNRRDINIHSRRESLFKNLGTNIVVCGSFHVHPYKNIWIV